MRQVALITAFIHHHRFTIAPHHLRDPGKLFGLPGNMGHIFPVKIIPFKAIVRRNEMAVRIMHRHVFFQGIPFLHTPFGYQIIFVRHAPPHIGECRKTAKQVIQVNTVFLLGHGCKAPAVIGMEEDQIYLHADIKKLKKAFFKLIPEGKTGTGRIPLGITGVLRIPGKILLFFKSIILRLIVIVIIVLREQADTDFVERGVP